VKEGERRGPAGEVKEEKSEKSMAITMVPATTSATLCPLFYHWSRFFHHRWGKGHDLCNSSGAA